MRKCSCENSNVKLIKHDRYSGYYYKCFGCGNSTGVFDNIKDAANAWNSEITLYTDIDEDEIYIYCEYCGKRGLRRNFIMCGNFYVCGNNDHECALKLVGLKE